MGFLKAAKEGSQQSNNDQPWYAESGTYPAKLVKVGVSDSDFGKYPVYDLTFRLDHEAVKSPTPMDSPDVELSFDTNKEQDRAILYNIIGNPMLDEARTRVVWDSSGQVQWNGRTDDQARFEGLKDSKNHVEVTIETKPPNRRQNGQGFWAAKYTVTDVGPIGDAQSSAENAAQLLIGMRTSDGAEKAADPPMPPKASGKASGKAK